MSLGISLQLEQKQRLIMTSELRQAIKVLQLSSLELTNYINQIITDNPLIELKEEPDISIEKKEQSLEWESYLKEFSDRNYFTEHQSLAINKTQYIFDNMITDDQSLQEHLLSQAGMLILNEKECRIANYLIGNINSAGYLAITLNQAAIDLNVDLASIEEVLYMIQNFDPVGVGARNLSECLQIQLRQRGLWNSEMAEIVVNHLSNIAEGKLSKVAQMMNLPVERVQNLADLIKTLNPKPGASFGSNQGIRYIIPDVVVKRVDGEFMILVNEHNMPNLTINKTYSSILSQSSNADRNTRDFVAEKLNQAMWLIRSIEQRRMTIYHVTEALVKMQQGFFHKGIKFLKPLTLKQIAREIGVHESTVSRATANKYIQTPHGIYKFKFFFTAGFFTGEGYKASVKSIHYSLQEIIRNENPQKPYSDQQLTDIFQERGINIARRTIAKYREELGIPKAMQRKRYN